MTGPQLTALIVLTPFVLLDLLSLYLTLAHIIKGHGASGVPVVSLLIYVSYVACAVATDTISQGSGIRIIALLTIFHALCHYGIPVLLLKFLKSRRGTPHDRQRFQRD